MLVLFGDMLGNLTDIIADNPNLNKTDYSCAHTAISGWHSRNEYGLAINCLE